MKTVLAALVVFGALQDQQPEEGPKSIVVDGKFEEGQKYKFKLVRKHVVREWDTKRKEWGRKKTEDWSVKIDFEFTVGKKEDGLQGIFKITRFTARGKGLPKKEVKMITDIKPFLKKSLPAKIDIRKWRELVEYAGFQIDGTKVEGIYDVAAYVSSNIPSITPGLFVKPPKKILRVGDKWAKDTWTLKKTTPKEAYLVRLEERKPSDLLAKDYGLTSEIQVTWDLKTYTPSEMTAKDVRTDHVNQQPTLQVTREYTLDISVKKK